MSLMIDADKTLKPEDMSRDVIRVLCDFSELLNVMEFAYELIEKGWLCIKYINDDDIMLTIVGTIDDKIKSFIDTGVIDIDDIANIIYVIYNVSLYYVMQLMEILSKDLLMQVIQVYFKKHPQDIRNVPVSMLVESGKLNELDVMILYSKDLLNEGVFEFMDVDKLVDAIFAQPLVVEVNERMLESVGSKYLDVTPAKYLVDGIEIKFPKNLKSKFTDKHIISLLLCGHNIDCDIKNFDDFNDLLDKRTSAAGNGVVNIIERMIKNKVKVDKQRIVDLYINNKINFTLIDIRDLSMLIEVDSVNFFVSDVDIIKILKKFQSNNKNKVIELNEHSRIFLHIRSLLYFYKLRENDLIKISSKKNFDVYRGVIKDKKNELMAFGEDKGYRKGVDLCNNDIDELIQSNQLSIDKDLIKLFCELSSEDRVKFYIDNGKIEIDKDMILFLIGKANRIFIINTFISNDGYAKYEDFIDEDVWKKFIDFDVITQDYYDENILKKTKKKPKSIESGSGNAGLGGTGTSDKTGRSEVGGHSGTGNTGLGGTGGGIGTGNNGDNIDDQTNSNVDNDKWLFFGIHLGWYILGFLLIIGVIMFVLYSINKQKINDLPADNPVLPVSIEELIVQ